MGLREMQGVLARVFTDPAYRNRWQLQPTVEAQEAGLSESEAVEVEAIAAGEGQLYAGSLLSKRLKAVEKLLPLSRAALNKDFEAEFRSYCGGYNPVSTKRHLEDAIAFCNYLMSRPVGQEVKIAAAFESAKLDFQGHRRRFRFVSPVPTSGDSTLTRALSFAIWLRVGRRVFRVIR